MYPHPFFLRRDMVLPEKVFAAPGARRPVRRYQRPVTGERFTSFHFNPISEAAGAGLEPATSSLHPLQADAPLPTGRTGNEKCIVTLLMLLCKKYVTFP